MVSAEGRKFHPTFSEFFGWEKFTCRKSMSASVTLVFVYAWGLRK